MNNTEKFSTQISSRETQTILLEVENNSSNEDNIISDLPMKVLQCKSTWEFKPYYGLVMNDQNNLEDKLKKLGHFLLKNHA